MIIRTEQLSKRFNKEWVFKNLSEKFTSEETIAILGPNGSGKSTLLQILWGQTVPTSGTITWSLNEQEVDPTELHQHLTIAAPYQDLIDEFTLLEQIDFHFSFKRIKNGISRKNFISALFLEGAERKRIENFSSGMRQRLRLGLALYSEAKITFLDEPTTNLDERGGNWYRQLLAETNNRLLFIATNTPSDYPENCRTIRMDHFK
ncbi:MAG: ABC transporter ATP-binding protein [Cyclobacteriaceae bacterium]